MPSLSSAFSLGLKAQQVEKGQILKADDGSLVLEFQYNPEWVQEKHEVKPYQLPRPQRGGGGAQSKARKGTGVPSSTHLYTLAPYSISLSQLTFDTYEDGGDVKSDVVDKLMSLIYLDPNTLSKDSQAQAGRPPKILLVLGSVTYPDLFLMSCTAKYTLFHPDLTPARAQVTLSFQDASSIGAQNPTSGGLGGETSYVVQPGDTLEGISFRELGDPTRWRAIAAANGIENPLDLKPGRRLFIPAL